MGWRRKSRRASKISDASSQPRIHVLAFSKTHRFSPGRRSFLYSLPCCTIAKVTPRNISQMRLPTGWQPARIMLTSFNWPMAQVNGGLMNCFQSGSLQRTLAKFTPNTSHPVIKGVFPPFDTNSCYGHLDPFRSFEKEKKKTVFV